MVSVSTVNSNASLKHILKTEREMLSAMERISSGKELIMLETMQQAQQSVTE